MATELKSRQALYGVAPSGDGFQRPTFWTKRKKTATSLLATLAMLAGIAIAYKLFERAVPNNTVRDASSFNYEILKMETDVGDTAFEPVASDGSNSIFVAGPPGGDQFPGDSRTVEVKINNTNITPAKDASFYTYVSMVAVRDENGTFLPSTDPRFSRFMSFFTLTVEKQQAIGSAVGDITYTPFYTEACSGGFRDITKNSPCDLGIIRAAGSTDVLDAPTDTRLYNFTATEADDGTDQSAFKGWAVHFELTFAARLPAVEESVIVGERS
ncbi:MAG TPA: hypothetical protein VNE62_07810 [Actinomycetota bacterium]|nr:hypothetical protein [Actinomycetota bacterium]